MDTSWRCERSWGAITCEELRRRFGLFGRSTRHLVGTRDGERMEQLAQIKPFLANWSPHTHTDAADSQKWEHACLRGPNCVSEQWNPHRPGSENARSVDRLKAITKGCTHEFYFFLRHICLYLIERYFYVSMLKLTADILLRLPNQ